MDTAIAPYNMCLNHQPTTTPQHLSFSPETWTAHLIHFHHVVKSGLQSGAWVEQRWDQKVAFSMNELGNNVCIQRIHCTASMLFSYEEESTSQYTCTSTYKGPFGIHILPKVCCPGTLRTTDHLISG